MHPIATISKNSQVYRLLALADLIPDLCASRGTSTFQEILALRFQTYCFYFLSFFFFFFFERHNGRSIVGYNFQINLPHAVSPSVAEMDFSCTSPVPHYV